MRWAAAKQLGAPSPPPGFFAYTCGRLVVVEDLHSGAQQHWLGHPEEISTLALSHDAQVPALHSALHARHPGAHWSLASRGPGWLTLPDQCRGCCSTHRQVGPRTPAPSLLTAHPPAHQVLASASGHSSTASCGQIRLWEVPGGSCRQLISHRDPTVRALAFSPDDRLLITLGQQEERGGGGQWPLDSPACPETPGQLTWPLCVSPRVRWRLHPGPVEHVYLRAPVLHPPPRAGAWRGLQPVACRRARLRGPGCHHLVAPAAAWGRRQPPGARVQGSYGGGGLAGPRMSLTHVVLVSLQVHRERIPEEVRAGKLTSLCYGAMPLLYCGSDTGQVCVWDTRACRCFLAWEADDSEIGGYLTVPHGS